MIRPSLLTVPAPPVISTPETQVTVPPLLTLPPEPRLIPTPLVPAIAPRLRKEPPTLKQLNAFWRAWLEERYHRREHSETGEPPLERWRRSR